MGAAGTPGAAGRGLCWRHWWCWGPAWPIARSPLGKQECHYTNGSGRVRYLSRDIWDRQQYSHFDSDVGVWVADTELGEAWAKSWNSQKEGTEYQLREVDRFCRHNYGVFEQGLGISRSGSRPWGSCRDTPGPGGRLRSTHQGQRSALPAPDTSHCKELCPRPFGGSRQGHLRHRQDPGSSALWSFSPGWGQVPAVWEGAPQLGVSWGPDSFACPDPGERPISSRAENQKGLAPLLEDKLVALGVGQVAAFRG